MFPLLPAWFYGRFAAEGSSFEARKPIGMIRKYLSLVKFSHTIFAMPFALIGFALGVMALLQIPGVKAPVEAWDTPVERFSLFFIHQWHLFVLVVLCMVFARSAAMAFNRYLDRRFDAQNPRTAIREIPSGIISARNALLFTMLMCVGFVAATAFINPICFALSPVALAVVLGYSYTKRFTAFCHLVLGVGLSLAPIGAYLAVTGVFDLLPSLFSVAVICWVSGFDIIYALQDEAFDRQQGLFSIPSRLGKARALLVSRGLHLFSAGCIIAAGITGGFGIVYALGAMVFCGMLVYQQSIVKPNDLSKVNLAFMTANGIASVVFSIFVIADIIIP
jgi:4-hydroxybenzoate polyprenyltransferase